MGMKPNTNIIGEGNNSYIPTRSFNEGDRVQVRNYTRECKWEFGTVQKREGAVIYSVKLDDGRIWRRHIDQMRPTSFEGED